MRKIAAVGGAILLASGFAISSPVDASFKCLDAKGKEVSLERCVEEAKKATKAKAVRPEAANTIPVVAKSETVRVQKGKNSAKLETKEPTYDVKWFLRRNMEDLGSFAQPNSLADSTGAELSWTHDRVKSNNTWLAQGLLGVRLLRADRPSYPWYLASQTTSAYVQFDRISNSNDAFKSKDVNDLVLGLIHESAFATAQATFYWRTKGELVTDFEGRTKNWNVGLEFQPYGNPSQDVPNNVFSYLGTPLAFTSYFFLTVSPKLRAEYRGSLNGSEDPIFATHNSVFRTGPAVTIALDGQRGFANVPVVLQRMHIATTLGYYRDWISSRNYTILDASLTENLDDKNYFGLTFTYRRGKLDTTGAEVNLFKISLSGKFGEDGE